MRVGKVITCDLGESQDPVQTFLYILDSGGSQPLKNAFLWMHVKGPAFILPCPLKSHPCHHTGRLILLSCRLYCLCLPTIHFFYVESPLSLRVLAASSCRCWWHLGRCLWLVEMIVHPTLEILINEQWWGVVMGRLLEGMILQRARNCTEWRSIFLQEPEIKEDVNPTSFF